MKKFLAMMAMALMAPIAVRAITQQGINACLAKAMGECMKANVSIQTDADGNTTMTKSQAALVGAEVSEEAFVNIPQTKKYFKEKTFLVEAGKGYKLSEFMKSGGSAFVDASISGCGVYLNYRNIDNKSTIWNAPVPASPVYLDGDLKGREYIHGFAIKISDEALEASIISWAPDAKTACTKHNFMMVEGAGNAGSDKIIFYFK
jgi:hypothetical protein